MGNGDEQEKRKMAPAVAAAMASAAFTGRALWQWLRLPNLALPTLTAH